MTDAKQIEAIRRYIDMNPQLSAPGLAFYIRYNFRVAMTSKQVEAIRIRSGGHGRTPRSRMDSLTAPKE